MKLGTIGLQIHQETLFLPWLVPEGNFLQAEPPKNQSANKVPTQPDDKAKASPDKKTKDDAKPGPADSKPKNAYVAFTPSAGGSTIPQ
uniref:Uncharacterized protein n=1 Tax=Kwoniella bestiolae CBS 10118 TaxID=1296100 RepID=A0A1B9GF42_9TREE|nr:hypothetical protein I302_01125 [Kwoniella bestiolae CBS 10118]OCF29616.1 hypothetical protein I302_01125 [Kwoniella bestiolae CBS 10118]